MATNNETIVRRWWEDLWNGGDLAIAEELVAPAFVGHDPSSP